MWKGGGDFVKARETISCQYCTFDMVPLKIFLIRKASGITHSCSAVTWVNKKMYKLKLYGK